ncbi:adenosylcobinamide-phosphate synthase CbiB [Berryella wangjianweii]|uniref:adenosylcobinamide-phosphate synthase CbiB n=1 Tax=Berryella wangjianweii TaxID=2734634 RepID=UPI0028F735AB|nr:adenosylcobinamide-phosphate synthase CbiB [Berryella wangjianweii]
MSGHLCAVMLAVAADLLLGDPRWLPHPVRWVGAVALRAESLLRRSVLRAAGPRGQFAAGALLTTALVVGFAGIAWALVAAAYFASDVLGVLAEAVVGFYCLAARSLAGEALAVVRALREGGVEAARGAVAMIVGRDARVLDREGVLRATVETVAENATDAVVAPLFYLVLFGPAAAVAHKVVSTLDSLFGYRTPRFEWFGKAPARIDDALNFVPARLAGLLMCAAAWLVPGAKARGALRALRRDRLRHASPNAAHTEAATAGALGIRLAGDAVYGGKVVRKPTLGDDVRPIEESDVARASILMMLTSGMALAVLVGCHLAFAGGIEGVFASLPGACGFEGSMVTAMREGAA